MLISSDWRKIILFGSTDLHEGKETTRNNKFASKYNRLFFFSFPIPLKENWMLILKKHCDVVHEIKYATILQRTGGKRCNM